MATLTDVAQQLHDIADQLTALSEAIVKAHGELGNQLQAAVQDVKLPPAPEKGDTTHG